MAKGDNGNYKERWLDILNIRSLKRPPRAPTGLINAMANASTNPLLIRKVLHEWKEGRINDNEACDRMRKGVGGTVYKRIEKATSDWEKKELKKMGK